MGKRNKGKKLILPNTQSLSNIGKKRTNQINGHKLKTLKNKRKRSKKKIQKLFDSLRSETQGEMWSMESPSNNTVIDLYKNNVNWNQMTPVKNSTLNKSAGLIVINDDDDLQVHPRRDPMTPGSDLNSSPIHCSTPIQHKDILRGIDTNTQRTIDNNNDLAQNLNAEGGNTTREINNDSYLTIDLTNETLKSRSFNESRATTIIDLVNNADTNNDSDATQSSSMSGDSQVTVIQNRRSRINGRQMEKFISGIAKLNTIERGQLLEVIAQKIFNNADGSSHVNMKRTRLTETAEDAYIKEVILGQAPSRNSIGSNIYNPQRDIRKRSGLRMVVIDGSNVAMQHSMGRVFSVKGLKICIEYFVHRGHIVKAFVPQFRCQRGKSTDGKLLDSLERQGLVVYTPSRKVQDKLISSYDDRYIVQCAAEFDGVIVSRDNYRDLLLENPRWRPVIENRLLQFTWVGDLIMFPKDPLGRTGPTLEEFLRHPPLVEHPLIL